jgi:hypothetical protein
MILGWFLLDLQGIIYNILDYSCNNYERQSFYLGIQVSNYFKNNLEAECRYNGMFNSISHTLKNNSISKLN